MNILTTIRDPELFGQWFKPSLLRGDTWAAWRVFLKVLFGLQLDAAEVPIYTKATGRTVFRTRTYNRATVIAGRRAGKSRIAALIAAYLAAFREYQLAPGETGVVMVIASDRSQARVVLKYTKAFFKIPVLARMVLRETKDAIELNNSISIEIHTSDYRAVRGRTIVAAILDELAFWPSDENSASPDSEIINAILPAMATINNALLLSISSPYARRGALFESHQQNFGKDTDELCWKAPTRWMNPTVSEKLVQAAYEKDAASAAAEYGAEFRSDVESLFTREAVGARVVAGRFELGPASGHDYVGFCDPSGGSSDSFAMAVAHQERDLAVLDLVREVKPPFSPENVVAEFAADLKRYRISEVVGDAYSGEFARELFRKRGIEYRVSERSRSELYLELLPATNSGAVELLDSQRLILQLVGLERRTARSGRDSVDHVAGGHDDLANAAAGALVLAASGVNTYGFLEFAQELAKTGWDGLAMGWGAVKKELSTFVGEFGESHDEQKAMPPVADQGCTHSDPNLVYKLAGAWHCNQCGAQFDSFAAPVYRGPDRRSFSGVKGHVDRWR